MLIYKAVKYLHANFLSFEFCGYVQSTRDFVAGNAKHHLQRFDVIFNATECALV